VSDYSYQAIKHDASINASRHSDHPDRVIVEIWRGDKNPGRIVMWLEDFERMASSVLTPT
jgi:hypothetical protein